MMPEANISYGARHVGIAEVFQSWLKATENFKEIEDSYKSFFFLNKINDFLSLSYPLACFSSHLISSSIRPYHIHFFPLQLSLSLLSLPPHCTQYLTQAIIYLCSLAGDLIY